MNTYNSVTYRRKKIFNLSLAMLTILNGYAFFFLGSFSIGMIIATVFSLLGLYKAIKNGFSRRFVYTPLILLMIYFILTLISLLFLNSNQIAFSEIVYNIAKLFVWATMISFTGFFYFDYKLFAKYMIRIAVISTLYLFIQLISITVFNIGIPNAFDFILIRPTYIEFGFLIDHNASQIRLSSFWMEPAQYGNYIIGALIILLLDRKNNFKYKKIIVLLFASGIIFSTSSGALYMMFIISFFFLISQKFKYKGFIITVMSIFVTIISILLIDYSIVDKLKNMGSLGYSIYRAISKIELWRESARIGSSLDVVLAISKYDIHRLIGFGVGNETIYLNSLGREFTYLNSFARTMVWAGFVGLFSYMIFALSLFKKHKSNALSATFILFCFIGGFYSGLWYSPDSIVFYIIAIHSTNRILKTRSS